MAQQDRIDEQSGKGSLRQEKEWRPRGRDFDAQLYREPLTAIFQAVGHAETWTKDSLLRILAQHPRGGKAPGTPAAQPDKSYFSKIELVTAYQQLTSAGELPFERQVLRRLQMKPVRTASGVAPVTVLTEPAGCPGRCIFCPDIDGMPKSYLPDEPGARRAAQCGFDPYLQVRTRLQTFEAMGHTADKVELLILGGTWSTYSKQYRQWFIRRCLEAMNDADAGSLGPEDLTPPPFPVHEPDGNWDALLAAQERNESATHRNVGLVIETRPDWVTAHEIVHLRRLGVTKVQLGVQSLDERVLALNERGHDVEAVRRAVRLLRAAGFKLLLHWMPNLYGATPDSDRTDFARLWSDLALRPDELKIYPCSIIEATGLYRLWQEGQYRPYTDDELVELVAACKATIPPYCRVNRVFRDIPADDIVAGSKRSNLRQVVHEYMAAHGMECRCVRCREVAGSNVGEEELVPVVHAYETDISQELFLSYETPGGRLAGFLRLSLPYPSTAARTDGERVFAQEAPLASPGEAAAAIWEMMPEIAGAAMIREVHVYGPALGIGSESAGEAQHLGLGRRLIAEAKERARAAGFDRLAVIAAIGTRRYYEKLGFERGQLYMIAPLTEHDD